MTGKSILVLGATGMLGATLVPCLRAQTHTVRTHGKTSASDYTADLTRAAAVTELLAAAAPDVVINLVGLTNVETCEDDLQQAYCVNAKVVENMVAALKRSRRAAHLIHISTDHVYDGAGVHAEDDVTITNHYAMTKYAGELAAQQIDSTVLRTNFIGRSRVAGRQSLSDWVLASMARGDAVQVLHDVLFSPLSMATVAHCIGLAVEKKPVGVFNLGARDGMSKADLAFALARAAGLPTQTMARIASADARFLRTYRPRDMRMDSGKLERVLDVAMPTLETEINRVAREYAEPSQ